ncbi:MAG: hypothetical protein MUO75_06345 [Actinobacteria bacterium]|nr:hypothetical protein [Actinomycetota bacterium]
MRADRDVPGAFEVSLSFKLARGEKALLSPFKPGGPEAGSLAKPVVEFRVQPGPGYRVEPVEADGGLVITANSNTDIEVPYRVSFPAGKPVQSPGEASRNAKPPLPIITSDLNVLKASQALICPRTPEKLSPISDDYFIEFELGQGQTVLVPWEKLNQGYSFKVHGEKALLENYVSIGKISKVEKERGGCRITVGFTSDHEGLTPDKRKQYVDDLAGLFDDVGKTMEPRPELPRLSILVAGTGHYGLKKPTASGLFSSVITFNGDKKLRGEAAAASAGAIFELWNRWMLVPAEKGGAQWFQEGMPWFYSYRTAALAGLLSNTSAYGGFSQVYIDYVSNPLSRSTSLADAVNQGNAFSLLREKGAVLCASVAMKLSDQTKGEKDMDWLLGELAKKYDHFQGKTYTVADIAELVEGATGKSWDRFFDQRLKGTEFLPPSEFSTSGLFGTESSEVGGRKLATKGSGRSWLILLVAVIFLFLIPVIFSAYVRRSVKLDLTMPRILPEDTEDES